MDFIRTFEEINKNDVALAGGKGASLGEMTRAGIPVPPGFVITAQAFDEFLKVTDMNVELDAILDNVDHTQMHTVDDASEKIEALITEEAKMPEEYEKQILRAFKKLGAKYVAVRSSATSEDSADAAWAGQLESYLNTTKDALLQNVKKCWASLFTPRAIFYRFEKGFHPSAGSGHVAKPISVAVVVQKMVESDVSGISFSVHPVTQDRDQLIIEAGFGLGEAIVQGAITPDSYVVEKSKMRILDKNIITQEKGIFKSEVSPPSPEATARQSKASKSSEASDADPSTRSKRSGSHRGTRGATSSGLPSANEWRELPASIGEKPTLSDDEVIELARLIIRIEKHYGFPVDVEWAKERGNVYIVQSRPITTLSPRAVEKERYVFKKLWTRDTAVVVQQAGYKGFEGAVQYATSTPNPYGPPIVDYLHDGVVEIWQNEKSVNWIINRILEKNTQDPKFGKNIIAQYKRKLKKIEQYWDNGAISSSELKEYVDLFYDIQPEWHYVYFSAINAKTPKEVKTPAENIREKDEFWEESDHTIRTALTNLYPKLKGYENAILHTEIEQPPNKKELVHRQEHMIFRGEEEFVLQKLEEYVSDHPSYNFEIDAIPEDTSSLKGETAYSGNARGIVHIVGRKDQVPLVKNGEIIVSPMTTPDFLPAMKKAVAFVTDEGGVTCHAAIVARELKKPCIIGTKIATQVLKDGDMVEVDAEKGLVRILKRAKKGQ